MKRVITATVVVATLLASPVQANSGTAFDSLAKQITRFKQETALPAATAVAVVKDGHVIYEGYFGYADIERQQPATADTAFYVASVTKPVFALSVLLQAEHGKLRTDTRLQQAFPKFNFDGIPADAITIKDLLSHTSGIKNPALVWATAMSGVHDGQSRLALVGQSQLNADAVHGQFAYSNVGYNIASVWLEQELNTSWQQHMQQTVLAPLGMTHSSPYISDADENGWSLAKPYSALSRTPQQPLYLRKVDQTMQAAGGLLASAPDLATFLIAQLEQGRVNGKQVLPASVITASQQRVATTDTNVLGFPRDGYAWGWYTGQYKGHDMRHHFGAFAGFHAHLSFIPEKRIGLVVLNNEDFLSSRLTTIIADHIYGSLLGLSDTTETTKQVDTLLSKAKGLPDAIQAEQQKIHGRTYQLSRARAAYVGDYHHPQLGTLVIASTQDNQLSVRWGRLQAIATGFDRAETLRVELIPNSGDLLTFTVHGDKVVSAMLDEMTFHKMQ